MQDDHVYRKTDLVGSSKESVTKAIETAIARAATTLRHIEWFEVGEIRGRVQDGKVTQYQVSLKVDFRVEGRGPRREAAKALRHPDGGRRN